MADPNAKKLFWFLFAGSRGGMNRISIIELLFEQPYNINQLSDIIKIDYKAIQHHIHVLEKNNLVSHMGEKYGVMYFVSNYLESNMDTYKEIVNKMSESKSYRI